MKTNINTKLDPAGKLEAFSRVLVFMLGSKGGVGKTWTAALLVAFFQRRYRDLHVVPIDTDRGNSGLSRIVPGTKKVEIATHQLDCLVNEFHQGQEGVAVVDCEGGNVDTLRWMQDLPHAELQRGGTLVACVGVVTEEADNVKNILFWTDNLAHVQPHYLFVKNGRDRVELVMWQSAEKVQSMLSETSAEEITLPRLDLGLAARLDNLGLALADAADGVPADQDSILSSITVRSRLQRYRDGVFAQFDGTKLVRSLRRNGLDVKVA